MMAILMFDPAADLSPRKRNTFITLQPQSASWMQEKTAGPSTNKNGTKCVQGIIERASAANQNSTS